MKHLMEAAVIDGMRDYLKRPEVYYALAMQDYNADRGSSTRSKEEIEKQVRQASKERAHYDEQATEFGLTQCQREIARKKSEQLERRLAELNAELRRASAVVPLPSESAITAAFGGTACDPGPAQDLRGEARVRGGRDPARAGGWPSGEGHRHVRCAGCCKQGDKGWDLFNGGPCRVSGSGRNPKRGLGGEKGG